MSAVSTANELLHVNEEANPSQDSSMPHTRGISSDSHSLEMLVRLIVKDELQRQPLARSSDSPEDERSDEHGQQRRRGANITEDLSDSDSDAKVMSAEEVAEFLGVDRNTVYDYAGRGTIPCRRLGKRLLFHRPVLVSWLDPCRAALTRKA
jgi:excisionase family DNA binding protein